MARTLGPAAARFQAQLQQPGVLVVPGCYDGLSAKLLAEAGHRAGFMSGFAVAGARGLPDTGVVCFAEMADALRSCVEAAPGLPLLADGDNGYGNAINVERTIWAYARAGSAAVMIEDQVSPKAGDAAAGKQVIGRDEACAKVRAACRAAREAGVLILARTDCRSVLGYEEAESRCRQFAEDGADMVYADGVTDAGELVRLCSAVQVPVSTTMLQGAGPQWTPAELEALGLRMLVRPHAMIAAAAAALQAAASAALPDAVSNIPPQLGFEALKAQFGFEAYAQRLAAHGSATAAEQACGAPEISL